MSNYVPANPLLDTALALQKGLIAEATNGKFPGGDAAYKEARHVLLAHPSARSLVPTFLRRCTDLQQFWSHVKGERSTYQGRRELLWEQFGPLIERLESFDATPSVAPISMTLRAFDVDSVHAVWQKALDRRAHDPEGAITAAKSLLETVCKHILDDDGVSYPGDADLPKLWALAADVLKLSPRQHQEEVFKAILGNCQSVVNNLGAIRNRIGDAHGQGRRQVRPKPRHAELAVNLAGTMASFLVSTWLDRKAGAG